MRLRDAVKLQDGDKVRCGPNDCGCTGRVYTVKREIWSCGCIAILHNGNTLAFVVVPSAICTSIIHPSKVIEPFWCSPDNSTARNLARSLNKVN